MGGSEFEARLFERLPKNLVGISECYRFLYYSEPVSGAHFIQTDRHGNLFVLHPRSPGIGLGYIYEDEWMKVVSSLTSENSPPFISYTWPPQFQAFPAPLCAETRLASVLNRSALLYSEFVQLCSFPNAFTGTDFWQILPELQPLAATPELDTLFVFQRPGVEEVCGSQRVRLHQEAALASDDGWFGIFYITPEHAKISPSQFADCLLLYHREHAPLHAAYFLDPSGLCRDAALVTAREFVDIYPTATVPPDPDAPVPISTKKLGDGDRRRAQLFLPFGEWATMEKLLIFILRRIHKFHKNSEDLVEVDPHFTNQFKLLFPNASNPELFRISGFRSIDAAWHVSGTHLRVLVLDLVRQREAGTLLTESRFRAAVFASFNRGHSNFVLDSFMN